MADGTLKVAVLTRICATCEYFDGGGMNRVQRAIESGVRILGDCHNSRSPRFTTWSSETCDVWVDGEAEAIEDRRAVTVAAAGNRKDNAMSAGTWELMEDQKHNGEWRCERIDCDGGVDVVIFSGPRALDLANAFYGLTKPAT